jgi:hypothetical protein
VVHAPDGNWYCNDDFSGTNDPYIHIAGPSAGTFSIWVGSYDQGLNPQGLLYVTEGNGTPSDLGSSQNTGAQNGDTDEDGIPDSTELFIAQSFMPVFEFDEEEHNIVTGAKPIREFQDFAFLYQVSQVKCGVNAGSGAIRFYLEEMDSPNEVPEWIENSTSYLLTVVAAYGYDYVPYDPVSGSEEDLLAHYGDTERVRICIVLENESYVTRYIMMNRHGESWNYLAHEIDWYENSHPYLYISEGKHATFASGDECEDSIEGAEWLGWDEDCSDGILIAPTVTAGLNVGEWSSQGVLYTSEMNQSQLGDTFPWEAVWSYNAAGDHRDNYFCGGYLVEDYSEKHDIVTPFYEWEWCGGGLDGKWVKPFGE